MQNKSNQSVWPLIVTASAILMITVNRLANLWGYMGIGESIGIALGFTVIIDGIYYTLTYVGSKNIITGGK